jgi:hypothetical protein
LKTTFILEHVYAPPAVGDDGVQRPPHELKWLQQYRVVEIEDQKPAGPLKVILLQDIEGTTVTAVSLVEMNSNVMKSLRSLHSPKHVDGDEVRGCLQGSAINSTWWKWIASWRAAISS